MRNVQCGVSVAERVRFWSDLAALDADASLSVVDCPSGNGCARRAKETPQLIS